MDEFSSTMEKTEERGLKREITQSEFRKKIMEKNKENLREIWNITKDLNLGHQSPRGKKIGKKFSDK